MKIFGVSMVVKLLFVAGMNATFMRWQNDDLDYRVDELDRKNEVANHLIWYMRMYGKFSEDDEAFIKTYLEVFQI